MTARRAHRRMAAAGTAGPRSAAWTWSDGGPQCPAAARAAVTATLARWGLAGAAADVALMVSELITNACLHGAPPVTLRAALLPVPGGAELACAVTDTGKEMPAPVTAWPGAEHGRGLAVVAALAGECGVTPGPPGKTVWFRLAIPAGARGQAAAGEGRVA
jgi:anti-sigma regulatory factor (Ser/Thr protein kinase)